MTKVVPAREIDLKILADASGEFVIYLSQEEKRRWMKKFGNEIRQTIIADIPIIRTEDKPKNLEVNNEFGCVVFQRTESGGKKRFDKHTANMVNTRLSNLLNQ